ncbi:MAG: peptidase S9 [Bacteroides sp. SM23_62]|nr:MAG: peptidase S9 [Bacteroides sp. SM23_62]
MNRYFLFILILAGLLISSCDQVPEKAGEPPVEGDFSGTLTQQEIDGGVLTAEILWKFGRLGSMNLSPGGKEVLYTVTRYDVGNNHSIGDIFKIPTAGGEAVRLTDGMGKYDSPKWYPTGQKIGFLKGGQLWEMDPDGNGKKQVSFLASDINSFDWSPDGSHILLTMDVKLEETPQEVYPDLPQTNVRIIDDLMYRHWNAWHDYAYSHIFVAPYDGTGPGEPLDIMKDEPWDAPLAPYHDDAEITWSPDGKQIAYTCKKMKGREYALSTNSDVYLYDLASGETKNLTKGMPGYDKYPSFSEDGSKLAFQSMATPGYEADQVRLFVIDLANGRMEYWTEGFDQDVDHVVWKGDKLYFISGVHATFQLYEMDAGSKEIRQITTGPHTYNSFALAGDVMVATKQDIAYATEIFLVDPAGGQATQLTNINKHIYDHIKVPRFEERWVKTTDNKDMLVWVIYPPDFDASKKYPAILFCGGGPQTAVNPNFHYRWNFQLMAAHDYIIVAPNRRGLPTFGHEWNLQISTDYGGQNMKDYLSAIDAVSAEPYVDRERLGAIGASYGGYSTFYLEGIHEGRFKTFISHCGVFNLESMYTATDETFFVNFDNGGPYWEKPTPRNYRFSPHRYIDKWDTPILITTGEMDLRIPYTQSLEAFNAARLRDIPARLLVFPEETHFVLKPQNAILWWREFFGWLDRWLK